ncbi:MULTISPECIES: hypothetical protein [Pectobacterium]|uniref:Uncharacterized protein n=1 Tax=Pectobacterium aquaticum TaxID=2204145 RepID=A0A3R8QM42_9GAMM|nr:MULTISPECIES: hypothetical protein [Pectobacterium]RRO05958.1 hypothetical protein DMB85_016890 [Pectobacterium aquaticum]UVD96632.1 hypothetical protein NV347_16605 [Pectobacterium parvum]
MARNKIQVHPEEITADGLESEGFFNIHVSINSDLNVKAGDMLSLQIPLDKAKSLYSTLEAQISMRK